eukprot:803108-Rhodomonas_salina.2
MVDKSSGIREAYVTRRTRQVAQVTPQVTHVTHHTPKPPTQHTSQRTQVTQLSISRQKSHSHHTSRGERHLAATKVVLALCTVVCAADLETLKAVVAPHALVRASSAVQLIADGAEDVATAADLAQANLARG